MRSPVAAGEEVLDRVDLGVPGSDERRTPLAHAEVIRVRGDARRTRQIRAHEHDARPGRGGADPQRHLGPGVEADTGDVTALPNCALRARHVP